MGWHIPGLAHRGIAVVRLHGFPGEVSPDRYSIAGGRVRARAAGTLRTLRDDEVGALVGLVRQAEEGFGVPVDVEFCFERRRLWLLQCRPITTL